MSETNNTKSSVDSKSSESNFGSCFVVLIVIVLLMVIFYLMFYFLATAVQFGIPAIIVLLLFYAAGKGLGNIMK